MINIVNKEGLSICNSVFVDNKEKTHKYTYVYYVQIYTYTPLSNMYMYILDLLIYV